MATAVGSQPQMPPLNGVRQSRPLAALDRFLSGVHGAAQAAICNPDNLPVSVYKLMRDTDETVGAAVDFIQIIVLEQLGRVRHPSSRVQKYLDVFWQYCLQEESDCQIETMDSIWAGFSVQELVPEERDGKIWLSQFPALDQTDCEFHLDMIPESRSFGQVVGVSQRYTSVVRPGHTMIDISRLAHFVHRGRNGNPYGLSRCKGAYKHWLQKDVLLQACGSGMERYGVPLAIGKCPNPSKATLDMAGSPTTEGLNMLEQLKNMGTAGIMVLPMGTELELVEPRHPIADQFKLSEDQKNKLILRAMLLPSLLMEPTDIGSFALGSKHFELFLRSTGWMTKAVRRFYGNLYGRFIYWNFGAEAARQLSWEFQKLQEEDIEIWSRIFFSMTNAGFIRPDHDLADANFGREKVGLDAWTELPPPPPQKNATPDTSGVTDPAPQTPGAPGPPKPTKGTPSKPQGRPGGKK